MRRFFVDLLVLCLLAAAAPTLKAQSSAVDGYWTGSGKVADEVMEFAVTFRTDAGVTSGVLDHPDTATSRRQLTDVAVDGSKVRFVMPNGANPIPFRATVAGDTMSGTFQFGPASVPFTLTRRVPEPPPYAEEEVRIRNGNLELAGTLLRPKSGGPHPAIVFQHAARKSTRDVWRFYADHFARQGIACLIYDNRGTGGSGGDYRAGFDALASDGVAAIRYLRGRKDINRRQIGLFAASQGGWIAPLVATRTRDLAFLVLMSAPAVTLAKNIQYESETRLRAAGVPEPEIREALALKESVMRMIAAGAPDAEIDRAIATQKPSWAAHIGLPAQDDWMRRWFPLVLDYDPAPLWARVRIPLLNSLGELDRNVRVADTVPILEQALKKADNRDFSIPVYPGADHSLLVTSRVGRPHLADGFMAAMTRWILERVDVKGSAK